MKPLAIVLGAGASKPFGLPTGVELKSAIEMNQKVILASGTHGESFERDRLLRQLRKFAFESRGCGWESIDRWLEFRQDYEQMGKEQIAWQLINRCNDALVERRMCTDWMSWLFNELHSRHASICDAPISFVTFNYDCLLEIGLATMLATTHNRSLTACLQEDVSRLKIVHVYGKLETEFAQMDVSSDIRLDDSMLAVQRAARGIKIMSQEREEEESSELKEAKQIISHADRVVFLGFGFDDTNLVRIGSHSNVSEWRQKGPSVWGTCVGKTALEVEDIGRRLGVNATLLNLGCRDLFREVKII